MKNCVKNFFKKCIRIRDAGKMSVIGGCIEAVLLTLWAEGGFSQNGSAGIQTATSNLVTYFDIGITLMYAVGGVMGLVGAIKVYQKWSHGDHDTSKVAASWFGSCIFLVIVATVLKSFFGLT